MQHWQDPELFKNDVISKYFQTVTPFGFTALHYLLNKIGIEPFITNKLIILPLFLSTGVLAYKLAFSIRPIATVAVAGSWLTCFFLGLIDQSLLSGTPRAFAVPLFLWFLTSVSKQSNFQIALSCAMQALFYPPISVISAGVLLLSIIRWLPKKKGIGLNKKKVLQFVLGNAAISICLLPFILSTNEYGPIVSATEARLLPAFQAGGRSEFSWWFSGNIYLWSKSRFFACRVGLRRNFQAKFKLCSYLSVLLLICTFSIPTLLCYRTNGKVLRKGQVYI